MGRYYFDIHDGDQIIPDEEGLTLPDVEAAYLEAARSLAGLAKDLIQSHQGVSHQLAIEVRTDEGPTLTMKVSFKAKRHTFN